MRHAGILILHISNALAGLALAASAATLSIAFELSDSYAPAALRAGYYACVSGLDFSSHTWSFDLAADGSYRLRGVEGAGSMSGAVDGEVMISSGPFASDDTATTPP